MWRLWVLVPVLTRRGRASRRALPYRLFNFDPATLIRKPYRIVWSAPAAEKRPPGGNCSPRCNPPIPKSDQPAVIPRVRPTNEERGNQSDRDPTPIGSVGICRSGRVLGRHAGPNPKYFGQARGVTWYNLLSNQFSGLNGIVVPGTLRDSLVLLALLLEQETELEPMEFMTDTAAYSDAVFGLFWLLGYQFSPRLADLGDARLWRIDRKADYGPFNSLSKGTINLALIRENWPDVIRLAGSLKLGHLKAAGIMRTLQVRDKPTSLARALSEIGRIAKTIHILHYIDDPAFRRAF